MTPKLTQAVKDYKAGNVECFDCLYKESEKYIYTCIYKVMSGNDKTQDIIYDIMQDTYVEVSKSIEHLADEERFLSWAGTIATRKCYAYLKKNKKYVLLNEDDDTFEALADSDDIIPEEVMQDKEKQRLIREIIETQLTEMQKLCIIAYYYNEQKQSEIAQELGIPENTVKTNLSRAKARIKEGVLDLEKNKGTKLYSFAPLFVLLFTEDVMAAEVPAEVGASVLSHVAEVSKSAATAETASVAAEVASETSTSVVGTTTSVASKVGVIGKIAAMSTKAKIIMAVATVSVAGTIGGGVIVASQNGLFGDVPIVNENQEVEDTQETEEHQDAGTNEKTDETLLTTETEEIELKEEVVTEETDTEIVNLEDGGTRGIETPYGNGLSDYEIWHTNSSNGASIHYIVRNVRSGATLYNADGTQALLQSLSESTNYEGFKLYVCPQGPIETGLINLKNMSDEEVGKTAYHTYEILYRTETDSIDTALVKYSKSKGEFTCYDYYVNDYTTGQSWWYMIHATESFSSQEIIEGIISNIEVLD